MGYKPHIYKKSSMRPVLTWCTYINSEVSTLKSNKKSERIAKATPMKQDKLWYINQNVGWRLEYAKDNIQWAKDMEIDGHSLHGAIL